MNRLSLVALLLAAACGTLDGGARAAKLQSPICQAQDAKAAFGSNALCVCEDLNLVGTGLIAKNNASPANVGVNGTSHVVGLHDIGGSLIAMNGVRGIGDVRTGGALSTAADVSGVGRVTVGGDMMVGGRVQNVGVLQVAGTLGAQGGALFVGQQQVANKGAYIAPVEPCACGTPAVDVAAKVADAQANGTNLGTTTSVGSAQLRLTTGTYFVQSLASVGALEIVIDGAVALAIGGSLETVGRQHIELTPGSTLDLYVAGGLSTVGGTLLGSSASPGAVRIFLGGEAMAVGAQGLNASVYAPRSGLSLVGDTTVNGALFVRSLSGVGRLTVDYSAPTAAAPDKCLVEDPQGNGGGSGSPSSGAAADAGGPFDPG